MDGQSNQKSQLRAEKVKFAQCSQAFWWIFKKPCLHILIPWHTACNTHTHILTQRRCEKEDKRGETKNRTVSEKKMGRVGGGWGWGVEPKCGRTEKQEEGMLLYLFILHLTKYFPKPSLPLSSSFPHLPIPSLSFPPHPSLPPCFIPLVIPRISPGQRNEWTHP